MSKYTLLHINISLWVTHTHKEGDIWEILFEKNIKSYSKSGPVLFHHSMLQLLELQGRTESNDSLLDLQEHTEHTAVNFTVDVSGEKLQL